MIDLDSRISGSSAGTGSPSSGKMAQRNRRTERCGRLARAASPLEGDALNRFRQLATAYPALGVHGADELGAQAVFAELTDAEQIAAVCRARDYAAALKGRDRHVPALHNWLRQTDFRLSPPMPPRVRRPSTNGALSIAAEMYGVPDDPADIVDFLGLRPDRDPGAAASTPEREAWNDAAMGMVRQGKWPIGAKVFVARDSQEGIAWESYFRRFGTRTRWLPLDAGVGAYMPCAWPPPAPPGDIVAADAS